MLAVVVAATKVESLFQISASGHPGARGSRPGPSRSAVSVPVELRVKNGPTSGHAGMVGVDSIEKTVFGLMHPVK